MLTQEFVTSVIDYNPKTGSMIWKERDVSFFFGKDPDILCKTWNTKHCGCEVGSIRKQKRDTAGTKYVEVTLTMCGERKTYLAHRLAWLYMTGILVEVIDHIDGDGLNNSWENLKLSSSIDNSKNSRMSKNNKSGFNGVGFHSRDKKWYANVRIDGKLIHGGYFDNIDDAIECRKQLNIDHGFHELHGLKKKGDYND